jgi:beta-lactamase regulating signal transducer with metallopeptidase domain
MNRYDPMWHIAGWTMVHSLWIGAIIAIVALIGRLLARRAAPNLRYAIALVSLLLLAATPLVIAVWLCGTSAAGDSPAPGSAGGSILPRGAAPDAESQLAASAKARQYSDRDEPMDAPPDPRQSRGLASMVGSTTLESLNACAAYLPWLWLTGTPITFALLAAGIIGTNRLRRASRPLDDGPSVALCATLASSLHVTKRVTIAVCDRIAAPVLVGILRPIILLPPAALTGWSPEEIEMVLLHELAHVRRWDNLVNLLQRIIESLLFFHPAVWLVSNWVRREREACCDAAVVARTQRPHAYAELLVTLAGEPSPSGRGQGEGALPTRSNKLPYPATSAMAAGPLRSRIRRILELEDDPMLISGKSFALMLAGLVAAATLAVLYLPTIGQAEESATKAAESTEKANPPRDGSTTADQTEPSDKEAGFEKALRDKISLVVVMFNDKRGYIRHLRPTYEQLARAGKTIWLYGTEIDPASDEGKRYGIGPTPTLIIFREGKETARLENIESIEQLNDFVAAKLGTTEKPKGKFPSLEEQKLADLAYQRLQLELEPIKDEELKRVQALGYDGGLRITSAPSGMGTGGILVGLHVWPTTSLKDVGEVLKRDDLAELNPLKSYVVARGMVADPEHPDRAIPKDMVITGRISAKVEPPPQPPAPAGGGFAKDRPAGALHREEMEAHLNAALARDPQWAMLHQQLATVEMQLAQMGSSQRRDKPNAAAGLQRQREQLQKQIMFYREQVKEQLLHGAQAAPKSALRYDGNPFEKWREAWLSGAQELEVLKALEAFASAGYGDEAADAILQGIYSESIVIQQHVRKFLSRRSAEEVRPVVAALRHVLETELSARRRIAAMLALAAVGPVAEAALEDLKDALASNDPQECIAAAAAIKMIGGNDVYQKSLADALGKQLGIKAVKIDSGAWAIVRDDSSDGGKAFNDFDKAVNEVQESLFPSQEKTPKD